MSTVPILADGGHLKPGTVTVVGVPTDENSSFMPGPALAPNRIREALLSDETNLSAENGIDLGTDPRWRDVGDLQLDSTTDLGAFDWRIHNVYDNGDVYDGPQDHWIAALQGRVALLPTAELALNTMLISEGIYLSNRLGREVTAEEVRAESVSSSVAV